MNTKNPHPPTPSPFSFQREVALAEKQAQIPLYECVSCDISSEDPALTSNCRQNRCIGQFCVYATQRVFLGSVSQSWARGNGLAVSGGNGPGQQAMMHEKQGCLNVTDPGFVHLGAKGMGFVLIICLSRL